MLSTYIFMHFTAPVLITVQLFLFSKHNTDKHIFQHRSIMSVFFQYIKSVFEDKNRRPPIKCLMIFTLDIYYRIVVLFLCRCYKATKVHIKD